MGECSAVPCAFPELYKEQYVDEKGGVLILQAANVYLHVPSGALTEGRLLRIEVKDGKKKVKDSSRSSSSLTPIICCRPLDLVFQKAVELNLPHCAVFDDASLHKSEVNFGNYSTCVSKGMDDDRPIKECFKIFKEHFCHVYTTVFADIEVSVNEAIKRRVGVVAYIREDEEFFVVEVWLVNDVPSEYIIVKHLKETEGFISFNVTGNFILDCHLPYNVDVEASFNGNYLDGTNNEKDNEKQRLDKDRLENTGRCSHSFNVAKRYRNVMVSILQGSAPQCHLLKKDNYGTPLTIGDVLRYCEDLSEQLLNWRLEKVSKQQTFDDETINLLINTSTEIEKNRRKKNVGVIGGSTLSITGGVMSIVGAALIPVTFGASVALLASGIGISVAGTGINLGFSIDKLVRDKMRKKKTKECLNHFLDFQTKILFSLANIFAARAEIRRMSSHKERTTKEAFVCDTVKTYVAQNDAGHTVDMLNLTEVLNDIMKQSEELIKCLQEVDKIIGKHLQRKEYDPLKTTVKPKDDITSRLKASVGMEFGGLAKAYLQLGEDNASGISLAALEALKAGGSTAMSAGAITTRVVLEVGDDLISAGGNALKIAQGISAAGIVLGVLGVVVDVAFIGHAIYDLDDMRDNKEKFSQGLLDIADLMQLVNKLQLNCEHT